MNFYVEIDLTDLQILLPLKVLPLVVLLVKCFVSWNAGGLCWQYIVVTVIADVVEVLPVIDALELWLLTIGIVLWLLLWLLLLWHTGLCCVCILNVVVVVKLLFHVVNIAWNCSSVIVLLLCCMMCSCGLLQCCSCSCKCLLLCCYRCTLVHCVTQKDRWKCPIKFKVSWTTVSVSCVYNFSLNFDTTWPRNLSIRNFLSIGISKTF